MSIDNFTSLPMSIELWEIIAHLQTMAPKLCYGAFTRNCPSGLKTSALATTLLLSRTDCHKGHGSGFQEAFPMSMTKGMNLYLHQFWRKIGIMTNEILQVF